MAHEQGPLFTICKSFLIDKMGSYLSTESPGSKGGNADRGSLSNEKIEKKRRGKN